MDTALQIADPRLARLLAGDPLEFPSPPSDREETPAEKAFWQHAENGGGAATAERLTNQERQRIERSEAIRWEEGVSGEAGWRREPDQASQRNC